MDEPLFLEDQPSVSLYELTLRVAGGRLDKSAIATELERFAKQ